MAPEIVNLKEAILDNRRPRYPPYKTTVGCLASYTID
jgi:hypothetical protein